jgi:hypothetical protein
MSQAALQFGYGRAFCNALDLLKEIVRQRTAGHGCPGLELAMQIVRDMPELDHL